jgi:hypothetical protein
MTLGQEIAQGAGQSAYYLQAVIAPAVLAAAAYVKAQINRIETNLSEIAKGLNRLADELEKADGRSVPK